MVYAEPFVAVAFSFSASPFQAADFSIFVSMLKLADLIDLLSTEGPVTIFAPTNEAFDGLPTALFKVNTVSNRVRTTCRDDGVGVGWVI